MGLLIGYTKRPKPRWPLTLMVLAIVLCIIGAIIFANSLLKNWTDGKVESESPLESAKIAPSTTLVFKPREEKLVFPRNSAVSVERLVFTKRIDDFNQPTDSFNEIPLKKVGRVYCYTQVGCSALPQAIKHVWINPDGLAVADIQLIINNKPAHTWSYVDLTGAKTGTWQVEVRKLNGETISTGQFLIYLESTSDIP